MPSDVRTTFLASLSERFGKPKGLAGTRSLFELSDNRTRVYVRYSKVHLARTTFFGLRRDDLRQLEGRPSVLCFLWDGQLEPLIVPYSEYEDIFHSIAPASDGQYKVQVLLSEGETELYIARAGRFNVEGRFGWTALAELIENAVTPHVDLTHWQVQTLLGAIGAAKGFDVWIPSSDRGRCDWSLAREFSFRPDLPSVYEAVKPVLQEIDVSRVPGRGVSNRSTG